MSSQFLGKAAGITALAIAAVGLFPGTSGASTVASSGGALAFTASAGEINQVTISKWDGLFTVTEKKVKLTAGSGCTAVNSKQATCTATPTSSVTANLGDKNDFLRLSWDRYFSNDTYASSSVDGGVGADVIYGGKADDTIDGGPGNDYLVDGPGTDSLFGGDGADTLDSVDGDDTLNGGPDTDIIRSWAGSDTIIQ